MGGEISKKRERPASQRRFSLGFLPNVSISNRLGHSAVFSPPEETKLPEFPPTPGKDAEKTPPAFIFAFLPEFPHRRLPERDHFQVLGFLAKGSYGPILKVKDCSKDKIYAVKVLPKSSILKQGALEQAKEEVIIQRQLKHPFIHNLQECWQTQRHLFIMCDYCSMGDLHTYWLLKGRFTEDEVRLFAAELGGALGFLHDLGIIHRDVKMENILLSDQGHLRLSDFGLSRRLWRGGRAFTICGTLQYMAPEVLSGRAYNHAADWWSLGILLFSLVTGEFPVPAEPDHSSMSKKIADFSYGFPTTFSTAFTLLLTELLCKDPMSRLRNLDCFKTQAFFRGASFDAYILQKTPVDVFLELRKHPDWTDRSRRGAPLELFENFECDHLLQSPSTPTELSPTLTSLN